MSAPHLITAYGVLLNSRYRRPVEIDVMARILARLRRETPMVGLITRMECDSKAGATYAVNFRNETPPALAEAITEALARYLVEDAGGHNGLAAYEGNSSCELLAWVDPDWAEQVGGAA